MLRRCQKIFENKRRCANRVPSGEKYCEKHRQPFKYQTYSVGHRQFSGQRTSLDYKEYIQSDAWKHLSKTQRTLHPNCALCHGNKNLQVHHSTYVRMGYEIEGDVVVLCENCHTIFHQFYEYDGKVGYFVTKK